mmetsp:Transcript_34356/g.110361  ORF Transcript_34356/g.110361 Transcript_34356/m.110361 type:complete len:343 (+) Transcript_34356:915-1943(+)
MTERRRQPGPGRVVVRVAAAAAAKVVVVVASVPLLLRRAVVVEARNVAGARRKRRDVLRGRPRGRRDAHEPGIRLLQVAGLSGPALALVDGLLFAADQPLRAAGQPRESSGQPQEREPRTPGRRQLSFLLARRPVRRLLPDGLPGGLEAARDVLARGEKEVVRRRRRRVVVGRRLSMDRQREEGPEAVPRFEVEPVEEAPSDLEAALGLEALQEVDPGGDGHEPEQGAEDDDGPYHGLLAVLPGEAGGVHVGRDRERRRGAEEVVTVLLERPHVALEGKAARDEERHAGDYDLDVSRRRHRRHEAHHQDLQQRQDCQMMVRACAGHYERERTNGWILGRSRK